MHLGPKDISKLHYFLVKILKQLLTVVDNKRNKHYTLCTTRL